MAQARALIQVEGKFGPGCVTSARLTSRTNSRSQRSLACSFRRTCSPQTHHARLPRSPPHAPPPTRVTCATSERSMPVLPSLHGGRLRCNEPTTPYEPCRRGCPCRPRAKSMSATPRRRRPNPLVHVIYRLDNYYNRFIFTAPCPSTVCACEAGHVQILFSRAASPISAAA